MQVIAVLLADSQGEEGREMDVSDAAGRVDVVQASQLWVRQQGRGVYAAAGRQREDLSGR